MKNSKCFFIVLLLVFQYSIAQSNTALDFDGVDDHILYTNPISGSSKSITLWVKTSSTSRILLASGLYLSFYSSSGKVYSYFDGSTGNGDNISANQSLTVVNDGNWHHIAATNNGSTTKLFIDGVLEASYTDVYTQFTPERIGGNHTANQNWFDGQVDEYATWSKALTQQEIVALMNHKLTGTETDLAVYFDFEEGVPNGDNSATGGNITQVIDQAGSNNGSVNNFTRTGTASNWVNGKTFSKENTALDFDGVDDYTTLPKVVLNTGLTYQAWIKTSSTASSSGYAGNSALSIIGDRSPNIWNSFGISNGNLEYHHYTGSWITLGSPFIINDGNWHHITVTHDQPSGNAKLFIDGIEVNSGTIYYAGGGGAGKVGFDAIGASYHTTNAAGDFFDGKLDEVRIWNRALTQAEIQCQMNAPLTGTENGLIAYYDFEEGVEYGDNSSLTTVFDKAGTNHGTVNGFAKTGVSSNWVLGNVLNVNNTCAPELSVTGNDLPITNGATPELDNHTDFGKLANGGNVVRSFTLTNAGSEALILSGSPLVDIAGSSDFVVTSQPAATSLAIGASTTFEITFTPTTDGQQTATVSIESNDPNSPFTFEVSGATNTSLDFDGSDDRFLIPWINEMATQEFTYEFWVKPAIADQMRFITKWSGIGGGTPGDFLIDSHFPGQTVNGEHLRFVASNGSAQQASVASVLTINAWNHVAVSFNNGNVIMYVNGLVVLNTNLTISSISHNSFDLEVGTDRNGIGRFNGQIDEVRIWNRALCQQEIFLRKDIPLQGNENGLVAYYDFEDGVPNANNTGVTEVKDKAGTNHGTPSNFDLGATAPGTSSNFVGGTALTSIPPVAGVPITWLGTTSDWNTASNWSTNSIPDQCSEVLIPVTANDPLLSSNAAVNGIEIEEGATLTLQPGGCLWVGSTFTNNGNFILQANSSNYAQYQGPQVYGTMQQTIANAGWHTIASPFIDATLGDINFDQNAFLQFGALDKCNIQYYEGGEFQSSPAGTWANAWGSWLCAANENEPFDGSRAYNLYLDDVSFADVFPVTMSVSGTLRNMPITQQFNGANGGWNNASNPFPSVLDFEKWQDNSAINNTYYVWDASTNNYNTYMAGGTGVPPNMTQYIAPYQSVFVKTSNGTTTPAPAADEPDVWQDHLTSNADRPTECPSTINSFFKTELTGMLRLQTTTADKQYSDETVLRFGNGYSKDFGIEEEADKFFSPEEEIPSIYSLVEDRPYVISSFPQPQNVVQHIPLGMATETVQDIIITATEIPEGVTAILEDKEKGVFHNLKSPYTFKTNIAQDNTRFVLHVGDKNLNENQLTTDDDLIAFVREGELVFYYNEELFGGEMRLINMAGQIVEKAKVEEGGRIDVSRLNTGLYVVMVTNGDKFYSQKIVVH